LNGFKTLRDAKAKRWNLIKSTSMAALDRADEWRISRVDKVTYQFEGQGLGWSNNALARAPGITILMPIKWRQGMLRGRRWRSC